MATSLDELLARFDPTLPLDRAHTIPAAWYHDPMLANAERECVFGNTWQVMGRVDQVAQAGSWFTADIAGEPVLVVRDGDAVLRAFSNVCRHRGARVACAEQGLSTRLRCRYHGWTYDLTGRLRGTPEFDGVADFAREDNGLAPLSVATWGPFVCVHLGTSPPPIGDWFGSLERQGMAEKMAAFRWHARREYRVKCNWKVYIDNYLDGGYHVNTIHPGLAGVLDYAKYRTELHEFANVQLSPLQQEEGDYGAVRSGGNAEYWWVFPNFMLSFYDTAADTNLVLPEGPDACRVIFDFYFPAVEGAEREEFIRQSMEVTHWVQVEDVTICEDVQKGLCSRAFDTGRFSVRREAGVYHFHRLLARWLRG